MFSRTEWPNVVAMLAIIAALAATGCDDPGSGVEAPAERAAQAPSASTPATVAAVEEPAAAPAAAASASFEFDPPELDFGILRPQQDVDGSFKVRNTGRDAIRILTMKATCACTELEALARQDIPPGESVEVKLNLAGRASGGTRQTAINLIIEGADKKAQQAQYMLKAEYARAVRTIPGYLNLSTGLKGIFTLQALDDRPFRVLAISGKEPQYADFDPASGELRTRYAIRYDFSTYDLQSCLNEDGERMPSFVAIETDHPDAPLLDLATRHRCTVPRLPKGRTWYIVKPSVNLGAVLPGEPIEMEVEVKWLPRSRDRTAVIHAALSEMAEMQVKLLEVVPTRDGYLCTIELTPELNHRGLIAGSVRFHSEQHDTALTVLASVRDDIVAATERTGS